MTPIEHEWTRALRAAIQNPPPAFHYMYPSEAQIAAAKAADDNRWIASRLADLRQGVAP